MQWRCWSFAFVPQKTSNTNMMMSSNGNNFLVTDHLCREFTGSPVNSPHKVQWRGALMFSLICVWTKCWENNHEAGDLRRYRTHYDVIVMTLVFSLFYIGNSDALLLLWSCSNVSILLSLAAACAKFLSKEDSIVNCVPPKATQLLWVARLVMRQGFRSSAAARKLTHWSLHFFLSISN